MSNQIIKHSGIVSKLSAQVAEVNIAVSSACAGCEAGSSCGMSSESKSRIIEIKQTDQSLNIGQMVEIEGKRSTGLSAVFFAYVLPFLLIMLVLILSLGVFEVGELKAGLYSLIILPFYYTVLYFFRSRFEKKYTFRIVSK